MAYNNKNFLKRREAAVRLANQHYEPGRQDRNYRWVWEWHARPLYHVSYNTFMAWVRAERDKEPETQQKTLFDDVK
jgi:hypothetical protein